MEMPRPTDDTPVRSLDCRGLYCPLPVLRTERALADLAVGEVLEVVATDPVAVLDMAVFSHRSGHPLLHQERRGEELIFRFRKSETPASS